MREEAALQLWHTAQLNTTARTLVLRNADLELKAAKALSDVFSIQMCTR